MNAIHDVIVLGRMTCPSCGIERPTTLDRCICGYNPKTGKVEESPLSKAIDKLIEEPLPNIEKSLQF